MESILDLIRRQAASNSIVDVCAVVLGSNAYDAR